MSDIEIAYVSHAKEKVEPMWQSVPNAKGQE